MFILNDDLSIYVTRGDVVFFRVDATDENGEKYKFKPDDVVRFKVFEKKACENVAIQKDFIVTEESDEVNILLTEHETKIGKVISKPRDYWYEIELNPFTNPQTIVAYDEDGPKIFRLLPEGKDVMDDIPEEELPTVDAELSLTSTRPVQNQAVTRAMTNLTKHVDESAKGMKDQISGVEKRMSEVEHFTGTDTINRHVNSIENPHRVTAEQVGARPNTWTPTAADVGARPNTWTPTAADVGAVPTARKVNNKALSADITLSAADVGAVPTTRTVNGKALSANISLSASDVGAYGTHNITCGTSALTAGSSSLATNNIYMQYQ